MTEIKLMAQRFTHSDDPVMTGMRGVMLDAETGFSSGRVFSTRFPTVFLSDSGIVEVGEEISVPADRAVAWLRAIADYIEQVASR